MAAASVAKPSSDIGQGHSAIKRVIDFAERYERFMGRQPTTIVVFAEDYAVLDKRRLSHKPWRVVPGPSVQEYQW